MLLLMYSMLVCDCRGVWRVTNDDGLSMTQAGKCCENINERGVAASYASQLDA